MARPVRIANCSGFYGDRLAAAREMLAGPVDVLTGDYLAELTMLILWKARQKDPGLGYATTFLRQMEEVLGTCLERGVKVVANAGGLNPAGLAAKLTELSGRLGLKARIAYLTGLLFILMCLLLEHWLARRRSLNWINTAFFRLNALISSVFLIVTVAEVAFQGGFRLR